MYLYAYVLTIPFQGEDKTNYNFQMLLIIICFAKIRISNLKLQSRYSWPWHS